MMKAQYMTMRTTTAAAVLGSLVLLSAARDAGAFQLELRVLLVATGDAESDVSRALMEETLTNLGVPFDVLDASTEELTEQRLYVSPERGRYNGIILTDAETALSNGTTGLGAAEFALLHDYERSFGVRESVLSGFPTTSAALGLDYGMDEVIIDIGGGEGRWTGGAGGTDIYEYVNLDSLLPIEDFSLAATPRDDGVGPVVEPLLVDSEDADRALVSRLSYEDGREVLLSTVANASFLLHSNVLAYEFVNFATRGLFIGARHIYLSIHNDDLFLADALWNPETQSEFPENVATYRWTAEEVPLVAEAQAAFRVSHPLAEDVVVELAFNGVGSDPAGDPLTQAVMEHAADFAFINHTFEALQMDRLCQGSGQVCGPTDFETARTEIARNAQRWVDLGLPEPERALIALLTDSHSGLEDRLGTDDTSDDIPFPEGFNPELGRAAESLGIQLLAGDTSRPNQTRIQRIPGGDLVLLPRHPTSVFYNVTNPEELTSEYNYIFRDSYLERGEDPCAQPDAICEPRTYEEILDEEAAVAFSHMLSFQPFPHYFHQSNLRVYDAAGNILQFDWLESVLDLYEQWMTLPVESPLFADLAAVARNTVLAGELSPSGVFDSEAGTVSLVATGAVTVDITGVAGGRDLGGQAIASVALSTQSVTLPVDPAIER
jgi:hypothetical protein